ncbi:MAG: hypothetical protein EHM77_08655 [Planctomycetaceae bacterium]|nr:MAG: hypothetical protein EHM77_08655 [Planctomycetaceae bacterium]
MPVPRPPDQAAAVVGELARSADRLVIDYDSEFTSVRYRPSCPRAGPIALAMTNSSGSPAATHDTTFHRSTFPEILVSPCS